MKEGDKKGTKPPERVEETVTFITCAKHPQVKYPKGSRCPQCESESKSKK